MAHEPENPALVDVGRRRYLSWSMDFDTRAAILNPNIEDRWDDRAKEAIESRWASVRQSLIPEFGERDIDTKLESFAAIGTKPVSVLSYHNNFFHQVRQAYVSGAWYPALVGACALGERILNHLILDMHQFSWIPHSISMWQERTFSTTGVYQSTR